MWLYRVMFRTGICYPPTVFTTLGIIWTSSFLKWYCKCLFPNTEDNLGIPLCRGVSSVIPSCTPLHHTSLQHITSHPTPPHSTPLHSIPPPHHNYTNTPLHLTPPHSILQPPTPFYPTPFHHTLSASTPPNSFTPMFTSHQCIPSHPLCCTCLPCLFQGAWSLVVWSLLTLIKNWPSSGSHAISWYIHEYCYSDLQTNSK